MTAYATRQDLYRYGLARGQLVNAGRLANALASTNAFELDGHGFDVDTIVLFRPESGGILSAPLVQGVSYYTIPLSDTFFSVAATAGGGAIDLTTDSVSVVVATPLPFDEELEFYSRFVDGFLPSEFVPLKSPYPITIVAIVAELAAKKLLLIAGQTSQSMTEAEVGAKAQLERWAAGLGVAGIASAANLSYSESWDSDLRGWGGGGTGMLR